ncbi:MAG: hypothetical protein U0232_11995 [Thermomicrobiales bacterium]
MRGAPGDESPGYVDAPDQSGSGGGSARLVVWRRFFVSPWPYLTVLLVPVAYSPVIVDNARSGWAGYWRAQGRDYAYVQEPSVAAYLSNLRGFVF